MSKYIDAEQIEEKFMRMARDEWGKTAMTNWGNAFAEAADIVDNFPAADVAEVKHGRWVKGREWFECSVCGCEQGSVHWHFCPNCGSRMDLDEVTE